MSDTVVELKSTQAEAPSQGQLGLERLLKVLQRLVGTAKRLDEVQHALGHVKKPATPAVWPATGMHATSRPPETRFFPALDALTGELEQTAGILENGVEDLKKRF